MRAVALWLAGALLLAASDAAVADVADFLGKPIASVRIEAEGREVSDPRVRQLIGTLPGSALSMVTVRETVTHLFSLGRYEDVRVHADEGPGGVALVYDLVPVHPIEKIVFAGSMSEPGIDAGALRKAVVERYGSSPSPARAQDLARLVTDELVRRGYLHPTVTPRVEIEHDPDRATLILTVNSGSRTRIGTIEVSGTPGVSLVQLLDRLNIKTGTPFEGETLTTLTERYQAERRGNGYLEARLTASTEFEENDHVVDLIVNAVQGPRVRVEFKGDPIPSNKHDELVPIKDEGSADEDLLEDSTNRIEEYLSELGYRDAKAPHGREESNGELVITFTVKRGPLYRVADVVILGRGTAFTPLVDLEPRLRVRKGQPLAQIRLDADVAAIADLYRREGFARVRTETAVEPVAGSPDASQVPVVVRITITEDVRTIVGSVHVLGNSSVPEGELLGEGLGLKPGGPFFLTQMAIDRDAIQLAYANRGFQSATVTGNPGLSVDGSRADVMFTVNEGPQLLVDHVLIVGNERTSTETIERAIQLKAGDPLGLDKVNESQRRLAELGLFRRVRITAIGHGDETSRDLLVTVDEAPVTSIGVGGGIEAGQRIVRTETQGGSALERLEFAPRAFFEIGRRNLFGKNRSINLFTRISLRLKDSSSAVDQTDTTTGSGGGFDFSEYRVLGTFREPRVAGTAADAFLTGTVEQQIRSSFNFARRAFSAEVGRRLTGAISLSGNYQIQRTELFDEKIAQADKLLIDRLFPQLLLSSFSISGIQSTRDDAVNPTSGHYFSANGQLAARAIGSEVGLFKSYFAAQLFRTLPRASGTVLATSVRLGMAYGFPRTVVQTDGEDQPLVNADGQPLTEVVRDLPASERFFAGGDTTVRGFALDQLGAVDTLKDGFAIGGNALVILNAELRVPVRGSFGVVGFFDSGNVFARTSDIDLGQLRSAVGFGIRYSSPVGPIRVDIGFKTHRLSGLREKPTAVHISLGQAF